MTSDTHVEASCCSFTRLDWIQCELKATIVALALFPTKRGKNFKDVRAQNVPTHRFFFKLATQKGNDVILPKRQKEKKKWEGGELLTSFWRKRTPLPKKIP